MNHSPSSSLVRPAGWRKPTVRVIQLALAALACFAFAANAAVAFKPATSVDLASGGVGDRIAVGDFDGDGNPDLVATPDLYAPEAFPNVDGVSLLYGDGDGGFPQVKALLAGEYLTDVDAADFNNDGIPDLVTAEGFDGSGKTVPAGLCASTGPRLPVFLGSAAGSFTLQLPCLEAGRRPGAVATGDFDEDGVSDLVVTISRADTNTLDRDTWFLSGQGNGSFAAGRVFVTEKSNHVVAADFNRDGHLDLAMSGRVYLGTGRGTFTAGPTAAGGEAVGDLNGDGIPDLASVGTNNLYNPADDVVRVRLGQPDGSFVAFGPALPTGADPSVESHPVAVAIADLNGDGYGDVVVVNRETSDVAIYLRDPAGIFQPRQNVSTAVLTAHGWASSSPRGLAIADWNRDGHPDIVVSHYNPSADGTPYDGTVTVLIQDAASRPAAVDDSATTPEDTAVRIDVLANDHDRTGMLDANAITLVRSPAHGNAAPAGGAVSYAPAAGFAGVDSFAYAVRNTAGTLSNVATVTVITKRSNKLPVAVDDAASTASNASVTIAVLANDYDPDGSLVPGTVALLSQPASGTASVSPLTGAVSYQPGMAGTYSFTYTVNDNGGAASNVATVSVTVTAANTPPVANDDSATTSVGTPVVIHVLANDIDPDGDALDRTKIAITTTPAHGGVAVNSTTGGVTYTPAAGYSGTDSFAYTVKDMRGATSNPATVTISVSGPGNLAPVATNGTLATNEDTAASGTLAATDPEGKPLTFSIVTNGGKGTATVTNASTGAYTYTPNPNANGTDSFTFRASDGSLFSNTATVTVTIAAVNDAPVAANDSAATQQGTAVTINVLANDSDVDGSLVPSTVTIATPPASGSVSVNTATGTISYSPTASFTGTATFSYTVKDNGGATSNAATVTVTVSAAANLAPVATSGTLATNEDTAASGTLAATDPEGKPLAFSIVTNGGKGTATVTNASTGAYTYTPNPNANGTDSFTFRASDGSLFSNTATVTVTIAPVNDPPQPTAPAIAVSENTTGTSQVAANDPDAGNTHSYSVVTAPLHGAATVSATGLVSYTPAANYTGTDALTVRVTDQSGASGQVAIAITVDPAGANAAPVAKDDRSSTPMRTADSYTPKLIRVLANDSDPDGNLDPASVNIVVAPSLGGAVTVNGDGTVSYTPGLGFRGKEAFWYTVRDQDGGLSNAAKVTVSVTVVKRRGSR